MTASSTCSVGAFQLTSVHRITRIESHILPLSALLEKFFQMKRSQCKDGLEIYKRFLTRMTRVSEFFKIAEVESGPRPHTASSLSCGIPTALSFHSQQMGIDKNDIPELTQVRLGQRCRSIACVTRGMRGYRTHGNRVQLGPIEPGS